MSRVRNRDTNLELVVRSALRKAGRRFVTNDRRLPGSPDVVFRRDKVAVFIHGDFWHGWRFPSWRQTVSRFWQDKIEKNRKRDRRNVARLRQQGWDVVRLWQHEIESDLKACVDRILTKLRSSSGTRNKRRKPLTKSRG
jgi:DNA mismatch endonuclease (patch repair protein)